MDRRQFLTALFAAPLAALVALALRKPAKIGETLSVRAPMRFAVTRGEDLGLSIRMVRQYDFDPVQNRFNARLDVMYGMPRQRPAMNCRIIG